MRKSANIPKSKLGFAFGAIRERGAYNSYIFNAAPFNTEELPESETRKWEWLKQKAVEHLVEEEELPSKTKHQDYERAGMSYLTYDLLMSLAEYHSNSGEQPNVVIADMTISAGALDKIVLPTEYKRQIIEAVTQLKEHDKIFNKWGFGEVIKKGRGVNMLFSGVSGTGKTYCGELIAEYTGLKAELISVASIESKYVGESEQNVSQLFKTLNEGKKVLILDEVDSFLTSRQNTDTHQHYAKLTNQFLVELERHNGICVMTTNRPVSLDKALQRRIDVILDFPFPSAEVRAQIWTKHMPKKAPFSKNVKVDELSAFALTGGQIKNALLRAARRAAADNLKEIDHALLAHAASQELQASEHMKNSKDHS